MPTDDRGVKIICPRCGQALPYMPIQCTRCGKAVGLDEFITHRRARRVRLIGVILAPILLVAGGLGFVIFFTHVRPPLPSNVVFTANFRTLQDPGQHWQTGPTGTGATVTVTEGAYVIQAQPGGLVSQDFVPAPYKTAHAQLAVTVTGTLSGSGDSGLAVECKATDASEGFVFEVAVDGSYSIRRLGASGSEPGILRSGTGASAPTASNVHTLVGACLSAATTTDLVLTVDGREVDSFTEKATPPAGWHAGLGVFRGSQSATTARITAFSISAS